jgi:carbon-monoxide dehydrogenase large subunit
MSAGRYVGARVPRREDGRLLAGRARFGGGVRPPGTAYAVVLRSPVAHGRLVRCDVATAAAAAGVLDVITPADAAGHRLPCVSIAPGQRVASYPLLDEAVRYAGQPLAVVVAATPEAAADAADLVELSFAELPAVVTVAGALREDAPLLYPDWGTNLVTDFPLGDDCEAAIAGAAHVVELTCRFGRATAYPLEPRWVLATYDDGDLTIHTSTQAPHHVREHAAEALGLAHDRVRVLSRETGGGFGAKEHLYPDEALACLAAMRLGRPVSWAEAPGDRLVATLPSRAATHRGRLALDADGRFLALHADIVGDLGAHPSNVGISPFAVTATMLPGPYRFEAAGARLRAVVTTTTPTGSYRGFGQPEAAWTRERLIDEAARRLGLDPVELRLRNMIGPDELPCVSRTYQPYDSGDYPRALRTLRDLVSPVAAPDDGRRRGIGYACHVEGTGAGPSMEMKQAGIQAGGYETAVVRMEPDASVVVFAGVVGIGQGIETTLAQIAADRVGVPLERVRVVLGDTDTTPYSSLGSIASRALTVGGGALTRAAGALHDRILALAAHRLEVAAEDLEIDGTTVRVKGDPTASATLRDIATSAWRGWDLPDGVQPGLEERATYDPAAYTFAYAAHAAAVAVDPETGAVEVEAYWAVNDCGVMVNPAIVEGQLRGGIAQGIGMALCEQITYTEDGQPLTEYLVPTTREIPDIHLTLLQTPSPLTPGGMKGVGESGTIGPPAAIGNAIAAAVPELADRITDTPIVVPPLL